MEKILKISFVLLLAVSTATHAADLPARKGTPCNCKLHIVRPDVFVNGQVPRGPYVVSGRETEGTFVNSADVGNKTASRPSDGAWLAHFSEKLPGLYSGDRVSLLNGGQGHLSWPDGSIYELTEPVTTIGPEICNASTAPVVAFAPAPAIVGALAIAAVAAGITVGVTGDPGNPPQCVSGC